MSPRPPDHSAPLPSTLDTTTLNTAIASLAPALELLERFHHRNKNQHRLSKWWAQADMLRRHVRKMLAELEGCVEGAERAERRRNLMKAKGKGRKDGEEDPSGEMVRKRAGYLRWGLGPGTFLCVDFSSVLIVSRMMLTGGCRAFTQLSADRQFAHLGLMLLGVLAQVDQAVAPFAPVSASSQDETAEQAPALGNTAAAEQPAPDQDVEMSMATDVGVAVSREEIMASIEQDSTPTFTQLSTQPTRPHPRSTSLPTNPPARQIKNLTDQTRGGIHTEPASKEPSLDPTKPKKKKPARKRGDEFDAIFGAFDKPPSSRKPSSTPASSTTEPPPQASKEGSNSSIIPSFAPTPNLNPTEPPKKKKKKAREAGLEGAGDEFDDIFGSLDSRSSSSKPKTKKKKQKKGGDEFDDIFGGL